MKNTLFLVSVLLLLFSCQNKAVELVDGVDIYATYLPEDTVDNKMYVALLGIDSARADFLQEHPIFDKIIEQSNLDNAYRQMADEEVDTCRADCEALFAEGEKNWRELLRLCAKKQYKEALDYYSDNETSFITAILPTTTLLFYFHYRVIGTLLFDYRPSEEAELEVVKILEYDLFRTESIIDFCKDKGGYIPEHYAFLTDYLGAMYVQTRQKEKALEMGEKFRGAMQSFGSGFEEDEIEWNMYYYYDRLYTGFGEKDKAIENLESYKQFRIRLCEDIGEDPAEVAAAIDSIINKVRNN